MKFNLKKITYIVSAIILAAILLAALTVKIMFSPERFTGTVENAASQLLDREVKVKNARAGFTKIVLEDIYIENKSADTALLSCEEIGVEFKFLPLLKKQFHIQKLNFKSPVINLDNKPAVNINRVINSRLNNIIAMGTAARFELKELNITDADINFYPPDFSEITLENINIKLKGSSLKKPVSLTADFTPDLNNIDKVSLDALLNIFKGEVIINYLNIDGEAGQISSDGQVKNLFVSPEMDLKYQHKNFPGLVEISGVKIKNPPVIEGSISSSDRSITASLRMDLTGCEVNYKDIYEKRPAEKLKLQGGGTYRRGNLNINWYLLELEGGTLSGTGAVSNTGDAVINIIGEGVNLKDFKDNSVLLKKYIAGGKMDTRSIFKRTNDKNSVEIQLDIADLLIVNFRWFIDLYKRLTGKNQKFFNINRTLAELKLTKEKLQVESMEFQGGDIEGTVSGYYIWDKELEFELYPRIRGRTIGLTVHGSTDNIKVGLK